MLKRSLFGGVLCAAGIATTNANADWEFASDLVNYIQVATFDPECTRTNYISEIVFGGATVPVSVKTEDLSLNAYMNSHTAYNTASWGLGMVLGVSSVMNVSIVVDEDTPLTVEWDFSHPQAPNCSTEFSSFLSILDYGSGTFPGTWGEPFGDPAVGSDTFLLLAGREYRLNILVRHDEGWGKFSVPTACPVDFAEPFGQLDFSDVIAFLAAFGVCESEADLAVPFGVCDFTDVLNFLTAFGAGCP